MREFIDFVKWAAHGVLTALLLAAISVALIYIGVKVQ